jgi:hypothetical protein
MNGGSAYAAASATARSGSSFVFNGFRLILHVCGVVVRTVFSRFITLGVITWTVSFWARVFLNPSNTPNVLEPCAWDAFKRNTRTLYGRRYADGSNGTRNIDE